MPLSNAWKLAVVLLAAVALLAQAPGGISGRLVDEEGRPVAGARIEAGIRTAITGTDGGFLLTPLPPGTAILRALAANHYEGRKLAVEVREGVIGEIEIVLPLRTALEQSVVVTGTSTPYLTVDAPVRTELVTQQLTDALVKRTLTEALTATVPGVRVESNCANCGFTALRLNGLPGAYTQILEDGLPSVSGVSMVYGLDAIPTEFLEQLEVVKGGNSSLYGPNAVAGVVNLVRREPRENTFSADTMTGWHKGRPEQQAGLAAQIVSLPAEWTGDFYFRGIRRTQIDRDRDGFTELPRRELLAGGGTLYRRFLDGRASLAAGGSVSDEFRRGGSQFDLRPEDTFITEQIASRRETGFLRFHHAPTPLTYYSLNTSYSLFRRNSYYGADFDPNAYGSTRNPLATGDAQIGRQQGKHTLLGGYQFWREGVEDRIPAYGRAFDNRFRNHGLYFQDEYRVSPRLVLVGGVRADRNNTVDSWVLSPRGNVRYGLTQSWNVRAGVSTGFRAPMIFDEDLHIAAVGGEGFLVERGPGLRKERSLSYNAALDYSGTLGGRRLQAGASVFSTQLRDTFQLAETERDGFRLLQRVNGAGSFVRGVDFSANIQASAWLGFRAGWTMQQARFQEPEPQFGSLRFFRTPNQYGFVQADFDLPGGFSLIGSGDFTGSMAVPHYAGVIPEDRLEASKRFAVFNLIASRSFDLRDTASLRLYVAALNTGDDFQRDFDRGPLRDSTYIYGPLQMRQFNVGMTLRF
ncbi:MAG: TonB-dependent receptor [Bryobacterales bacterium]|nr:TonB-dependent receptor [Bryobacterales bacterium]